MIYLILKSYFVILLSVAIACIVTLAVGLYAIIRNRLDKLAYKEDVDEHGALALDLSLPDITAIAGDDMIATHLDLARAYIETNQQALAQKVLEQAVRQGTKAQQAEAQALLSTLHY